MSKRKQKENLETELNIELMARLLDLAGVNVTQTRNKVEINLAKHLNATELALILKEAIASNSFSTLVTCSKGMVAINISSLEGGKQAENIASDVREIVIALLAQSFINTMPTDIDLYL